MISIEDLLALMRSRRSIRKFSDDPLPEGCEEMLLEAFRWAPSGGNVQPWHVIVVKKGEVRQRLCEASLSQKMVIEAPLLFVISVDLDRAFQAYKQRGVELYCLQDTAAAIQNLLLAAHTMGLGACWMGAFREKSVAQIVGLPSHLRPVAMVVAGMPAEAPPIRSRRALEEVVSTR